MLASMFSKPSHAMIATGSTPVWCVVRAYENQDRAEALSS